MKMDDLRQELYVGNLFIYLVFFMLLLYHLLQKRNHITQVANNRERVSSIG